MLSGHVALAIDKPDRTEGLWEHLRGLKILLPFAFLVAIWWAVEAAGDFPQNLLVSPLQAWRAFVHLVSHGVMAEYASTSLTMIGTAAFISMAAGVPIGFLVGVNRYAAHALEGFLRFLQGISGIAWLPLAIIWFGFSHTTTLVIVIYSLIVPRRTLTHRRARREALSRDESDRAVRIARIAALGEQVFDRVAAVIGER